MPLRELNLSRIPEITPQGLFFLREMPLAVLQLTLGQSSPNADAFLETLVGTPLRELNIYGARGLTGVGLGYLGCMALTHLNLGCCKLLKDADMAVLEGMPLTSLNLAGCLLLTDAALGYLVRAPLLSISLGQFSNAAAESVCTRRFSQVFWGMPVLESSESDEDDA